MSRDDGVPPSGAGPPHRGAHRERIPEDLRVGNEPRLGVQASVAPRTALRRPAGVPLPAAAVEQGELWSPRTDDLDAGYLLEQLRIVGQPDRRLPCR